MSTLKVNAVQNTSGVEMYLAKAWVNFNGTGTVAIRASGNVSSITDNGVGNYTVNFTNAMSDGNYSVTGSAIHNTAANDGAILFPTNLVAASVTIATEYVSSTGGATTGVDCPVASVAIFR